MFFFTPLLICGYAVYLAFFSPTAKLPVAKMQELAQQSTKNYDRFPLLHRFAVVTGCTSGIGQEIAAELYRLGATVIMASRSMDKLAVSTEEIKKIHPESLGTLTVLTLDTSDLTSVAAFANKITHTYKHIHYLVLNAGIHYVSNGALDLSSKQGYDLAFATNYLGHFQLTEMLLPLLQAGGTATGVPSKILSVSSSYHFLATADTLAISHQYDDMPLAASSAANAHNTTHRAVAYPANKLAQILHMKELQRQLDAKGDTSVKTLSFCPGWVATNIIPKNIGGILVAMKAFSPNAAILGALTALFDETIPAASFVASYKNFWTSQSWFPSLMDSVDKYNMRHSVLVNAAFAGWVLMFQAASYGAHVSVSSKESNDKELAESLFAWSKAAVRKYIPIAEKEAA